MEFPSNFRAKKSFGQNFLIQPAIVERIVAAGQITSGDDVVEVGPGLGILTKALLKKARHVTAIEKDHALYEQLLLTFLMEIGDKKLTLIHADALTVPPPTTPYTIVANIPYAITSPLLDHFIRKNPTHPPKRVIMLVQKEVAEKICATPPNMNVLALHVQTFGVPEYLFTVGAGNFTPRPKVDSAVIKIEFPPDHLPPHLASPKNMAAYFELIHTAFSHKRKMLRATLPQELLARVQIDGTRRPETLSLHEWSLLASV